MNLVKLKLGQPVRPKAEVAARLGYAGKVGTIHEIRRGEISVHFDNGQVIGFKPDDLEPVNVPK